MVIGASSATVFTKVCSTCPSAKLVLRYLTSQPRKHDVTSIWWIVPRALRDHIQKSSLHSSGTTTCSLNSTSSQNPCLTLQYISSKSEGENYVVLAFSLLEGSDILGQAARLHSSALFPSLYPRHLYICILSLQRTSYYIHIAMLSCLRHLFKSSTRHSTDIITKPEENSDPPLIHRLPAELLYIITTELPSYTRASLSLYSKQLLSILNETWDELQLPTEQPLKFRDPSMSLPQKYRPSRWVYSLYSRKI